MQGNYPRGHSQRINTLFQEDLLCVISGHLSTEGHKSFIILILKETHTFVCDAYISRIIPWGYIKVVCCCYGFRNVVSGGCIIVVGISLVHSICKISCDPISSNHSTRNKIEVRLIEFQQENHKILPSVSIVVGCLPG